MVWLECGSETTTTTHWLFWNAIGLTDLIRHSSNELGINIRERMDLDWNSNFVSFPFVPCIMDHLNFKEGPYFEKLTNILLGNGVPDFGLLELSHVVSSPTLEVPLKELCVVWACQWNLEEGFLNILGVCVDWLQKYILASDLEMSVCRSRMIDYRENNSGLNLLNQFWNQWIIALKREIDCLSNLILRLLYLQINFSNIFTAHPKKAVRNRNKFFLSQWWLINSYLQRWSRRKNVQQRVILWDVEM